MAATLPTVTELAEWYGTLVKTSTGRGRSHAQAFFYAACWSNDAEIERVFEAWVETNDNPHHLPMDLLEADLVRGERWAELHSFLGMLDAAQLERALPLMRAFVADPKKRRRR